MIDSRLEELAAEGRETNVAVVDFFVSRSAAAIQRDRRAVIVLRRDDVAELRALVVREVQWSSEALELMRQSDIPAHIAMRALCDAVTKALSDLAAAGEVSCPLIGSVQSSADRFGLAVTTHAESALVQLEKVLSERRARGIVERSRSAIEFKEDALASADALLAAGGPSEVLAAIAVIDLVWREAAYSELNATIAAQKRLPLKKSPDLGALGHQLLAEGLIDLASRQRFDMANGTRNAALHARTPADVPTVSAAREMLHFALNYRGGLQS